MSEDCVSMETTAIARQGSRTCPWSSMGLILSREDRLGVEGEVYEVQYVGLCQDTEHRVIFWIMGRYFAEFNMCGLLDQSENPCGLTDRDGSTAPELRPVALLCPTGLGKFGRNSLRNDRRACHDRIYVISRLITDILSNIL